MRSHRRVALLAPLTSLAFFSLAPALAAQARDSMPFHKGQWGVDFRVGSGFAGVGALHFTSPTRAMLIDVSGAYSHISNTSTTPTPPVRGSNVNAALSLGRRAYHLLDPHVYRWTTLGLSFNYDRQSTTQGGVTQTGQGLGAGVFANLGATWLVTPHLGLGAQWQVDVTYSHGKVTSSVGTGKFDFVALELARVALTGQFYF
jgi:hypothetical protein